MVDDQLIHRIFNLEKNHVDFDQLVLNIFKFQAEYVEVYREYVNHLGINPHNVKQVEMIPFLPVEFFKTKEVIAQGKTPEVVFSSSGTTGMVRSHHYVASSAIYSQSFIAAFKKFYGNPNEYCILALLPSYLEREGSSLVYMVDELIKQTGHPDSGFYLHNLDDLAVKLQRLDDSGQKVLLIGVSFALLDLIEQHQLHLNHTVVMETGGMKGTRRELPREELHQVLCDGLGVSSIHSEYGMTELLSQGYSSGSGLFKTPAWMKVIIRDTNDPFSFVAAGQTGGINIIDLANLYSCSFLELKDLGKVHPTGEFEVLGRFDTSDIRGCNLLLNE
ncbi:MAG TPA: hypothetical protein VMW01_03620 [Williamwhitmania sp.]|nr:hypothetical protein [Williamwhitmania sp.]